MHTEGSFYSLQSLSSINTEVWDEIVPDLDHDLDIRNKKHVVSGTSYKSIQHRQIGINLSCVLTNIQKLQLIRQKSVEVEINSPWLNLKIFCSLN